VSCWAHQEKQRQRDRDRAAGLAPVPLRKSPLRAPRTAPEPPPTVAPDVAPEPPTGTQEPLPVASGVSLDHSEPDVSWRVRLDPALAAGGLSVLRLDCAHPAVGVWCDENGASLWMAGELPVLTEIVRSLADVLRDARRTGQTSPAPGRLPEPMPAPGKS
jgi:hypothetical protein